MINNIISVLYVLVDAGPEVGESVWVGGGGHTTQNFENETTE